MPKPLDERIAAALAPGARAVTVADLIGEITVEIAATIAERNASDAASKSLETPEDEADAAADAVVKLERKAARLTAKREQLEARHTQLMNTERRKRAEAEHAEIIARRDDLVADLRTKWPRLVDEMIGLLRRIEASDAEIDAFQKSGVPSGMKWLQSAESMARDVPANWVHANGAGQVARFTKIKIPAFDGRETAWPDVRPDRERAIRHDADERRQRLAAKQDREASLARFKRYEIAPPSGDSPLVATFHGPVNIVRHGEVRMTAEQAESARAKGCTVELLDEGKTVGMPMMGTL